MGIIGIDLGTTNSVLSIFEDGQPKTLVIDKEKLLPSVIHLSDDGFVVGKMAKNLLVLEPENTVSSVKRKMGQDINLPIGEKVMRPEELSGLILKKIKKAAVDFYQLGEEDAVQAVITVPAYFTEEQRQATRQAADFAGLKTERIINEPTAAALAFGMSSLEEAIYAVYDLGGGTFDISIIESDQGMVEVLATSGDNELGGDDFDAALANFIWDKFIKRHQLTSLKKDRRTEAKLLRLAELTKIQLSTEEKHAITESFFLSHKGSNYHLEMIITRKEFEDLIGDKINQTVQLLSQAIRDAKLKTDEVNGIILVGGSSRIPLVKERIEKETGILPQLINLPDEAVAHGAAIQGAIIDNKDVKTILIDITPYTLGVGVMDARAEQSLFEAALNKEDPETFRPNLGASCLIRKNSPIPANNKDYFYGNVPHQKKFQIQVFQGEEDRFKNNRKIGECFLEVKNPPEHPEIEVSFNLDINGILNIEAVETTTKEKVKASFKSSRGQRIRKEILDEMLLVNSDDSENLLIKRANKLLEKDNLNEEDQKELEDLVAQYSSALLDMNGEDEEIKTELLDLLFYLESNK